MATLANLIVNITANTADLSRTLVSSTTQIEQQLNTVGASAGRLSTFMDQAKGAFVGFVAAHATMATVRAAWRALTEFVGSSIRAYAEQEAATVKLTQALRSQGSFTPQLSRHYQDLAASFQQTTVFGDELLLEMTALLTQIGNVGPRQMRAALQASTALAAGLGIDLRAATLLVGKAFAGETGSLSRYGIVVNEADRKVRGVTAVLDALHDKFGGQAQAAIQGYTGRTQQLANTWGDVKEQIGEAIVTLPLFEASLRALHDATQRSADDTTKLSRAWDLVGKTDATGLLKGVDALNQLADAANVYRRHLDGIRAMPSPWKAAGETELPLLRNGLERSATQMAALTTRTEAAAAAAKTHALAVSTLSEQLRELLVASAIAGMRSEITQTIPVLANLTDTSRAVVVPATQIRVVTDAWRRSMDVLATNTLPPAIQGIKDLGAAAQGAGDDIMPLGQKIGQGLMKNLAAIPGMIASAFTGGGGFGGALKGIGTMVASTVGETIGSGIARLGKLGGPIGAAIGSLAGPLIDMFANMFDHVGKDFKRMGREMGVQFSDGMIEQLKRDKKRLGDEVAALLTNLPKVIQEAGGLEMFGIDKAIAKTHDLFSMIETGKLTVQEAGAVFSEMFGVLIPHMIDETTGRLTVQGAELIALDERFGTHAQAVADFIRGQGEALLGLFPAIAESVEPALARIAGIKDRLNELSETGATMETELVGLMTTVFGTDEENAARALRIDEIQKAMAGGTIEQNHLNADLQASIASVGVELEDLATIAMSTFASSVAAGVPYHEALRQIAPSVNLVAKGFQDLGIDIDNAAFRGLAFQTQLLERNPGLVAGMGALADQFAVLDNLGLQNEETFRAMERTGAQMYTRIQGEVAAMGGTSRDALLQMQSFLHQAELSAEALGIPLDDNTQLLIDQSKELGLWKESGKGAMELLTDKMGALVDKVGLLIDELRGADRAVREIPDRDIQITATIDLPPPPDWTPYMPPEVVVPVEYQRSEEHTSE